MSSEKVNIPIQKKSDIATKKDFLRHPIDKGTFAIVSLGVPSSGKSWNMLHSLNEWVDAQVYDEYFIVFPTYYIEQNNSYAFLKKHEHKKNFHIFTSFYPEKLKEIMVRNEKLKKAGKDCPKVFVCIDDATTQKSSLFMNPIVTELVVICRHINWTAWFLLHSVTSVIAPTIRNNIMYVFLYHVSGPTLQDAYKQYVDHPDFKKFKDFEEYWYKNVETRDHGCFYIDKKERKYSCITDLWFKNEL